MAVLWADFPSGQKGLYGTSLPFVLDGIYAETLEEELSTLSITNDIDPNIGSNGYVLLTYARGSSGSVHSGLRFVCPTPGKTMGFSARLWMSELPQSSDNSPLIAFRNGANSTIVGIRVTTTGRIEARAGETKTATLLGQTAGPVLTASAYHRIEVKVFSDAAAGTIQVTVDGVTVLDLNTLNTDGADIEQYFFGMFRQGGSFHITTYWKDVIFWDTTGTENNDFFGNVYVYDLIPDGDSSLGWTPSTGSTGYNLVDEGDTGPDDADYISADATPPSPTIFTMTNLPEDVTSIKALINIGRMMKTDGGDCDIQMALSPEGTNWDSGADRPITVAETYWWDVSNVSPTTAVAWTPTEVNSLLFRFDRTL